METYLGILDKEIIATAMAEYENVMKMQGNQLRAAHMRRVAERLNTWLDHHSVLEY